MACPCGSDRDYDSCCGLYLAGRRNAPTAEALMRSRYAAYTRADIAYLARTHAPETRANFDPGAARDWAMRSTWRGLTILATCKGDVVDSEGTVEFVATYEQNGVLREHRELSRFRKTDAGEWVFVEGAAPASSRTVAKVGRNDPCPCGSGRKFKKCCGA
jgi:SEC-C motif-containing protein